MSFYLFIIFSAAARKFKMTPVAHISTGQYCSKVVAPKGGPLEQQHQHLLRTCQKCKLSGSIQAYHIRNSGGGVFHDSSEVHPSLKAIAVAYPQLYLVTQGKKWL